MTQPSFPLPDPCSQEPQPAPHHPLDALAESMHLLEQRLLTWFQMIAGDAATDIHPNPDPSQVLADSTHFEPN